MAGLTRKGQNRRFIRCFAHTKLSVSNNESMLMKISLSSSGFHIINNNNSKYNSNLMHLHRVCKDNQTDPEPTLFRIVACAHFSLNDECIYPLLVSASNPPHSHFGLSAEHIKMCTTQRKKTMECGAGVAGGDAMRCFALSLMRRCVK